MAGVSLCLSSTLGASSCCQLDSADSVRWQDLRGAGCSRRMKRNSGKKALHCGSVRRSSVVAAAEVPDFLPATWAKPDKPIGPTFDLTAEQATLVQLNSLRDNDKPYADHGIEIMYRFAGFDPFKRSEYFGPLFDLGQFERFRRILHHTSFRVLLGHTDRRILSSLFVDEHCFKQRVWIVGARPGKKRHMNSPLSRKLVATGMGIGSLKASDTTVKAQVEALRIDSSTITSNHRHLHAAVKDRCL